MVSTNLRPPIVNVHEIISEVMVMIRPVAMRYNATVTVNLTDLEAQACIYADEIRLHEIILNLITNACKYGAGTINIAAFNENELIIITVTDNGQSLTPDQLNLMWQPFSRISADHY